MLVSMSVLRCLLKCQPVSPSQSKCDLICQLVRPNRSWRVRITLSTVFFPLGQVQPYQPNEVFHVFPELELIESLRVSDTNFGWQRFSFMEAFPEAMNWVVRVTSISSPISGHISGAMKQFSSNKIHGWHSLGHIEGLLCAERGPQSAEMGFIFCIALLGEEWGRHDGFWMGARESLQNRSVFNRRQSMAHQISRFRGLGLQSLAWPTGSSLQNMGQRLQIRCHLSPFRCLQHWHTVY